MTPLFSIGLTGGIASGKSSAAGYFSKLGATVISADHIARDILAKNSPTLAAVVEAFGSDILDAGQALDRAKLRTLIFKNKTARTQLDAITHPAIGKALIQATRQIPTTSPLDYVVLEIPLLIEAKMTALVDRVLVINIAQQVQIQRVMQRDHGTRREAELAIAAQIAAHTRLHHADDIIHNNGSINKLKQQVTFLHNSYTKLAAAQAGNTRPALANKSQGYTGLDLH